MVVHKPFLLTELKQLKADLGNYTNLNNYTGQFYHISLAYDLAWKDIMITLGQALSTSEQERVIKEAGKFVSSLHLFYTQFPIGEEQVSPLWILTGIIMTCGRGTFPPLHKNQAYECQTKGYLTIKTLKLLARAQRKTQLHS